jgi:5-methyltetrahydrofolate--homocysteine methyltransferase
MIKQYEYQEKYNRNEVLANHSISLKGNTDLLNLTRPDVIKAIHLEYLKAGADIISTNTFGANSISQADYDINHLVYEMNKQAALLARQSIIEFAKKDANRPYFVAGAMGPTTKLASLSPKMNDPAFRDITFDQLVAAYTEQAKALIEGGIDVFLLETITDTLNAKAALFALMTLFEELGKEYPIMVSGTITDQSGRILSGQTLEAFLISIAHAPILSVGLNCALGAEELRPYIQVLDKESPFFVSVHPNAGLPNEFGEYDQSAAVFAELIADFARNGWLNIAGGCCGTTPEHIKAMAAKLKQLPPRTTLKLEEKKKNTSITQPSIVQLVNHWEKNISTSVPTFQLKELMHIVSKTEDEATFRMLKANYEKEKSNYHTEQALLIDAHIYGRYQYLRIENKLERSNIK